MKVDKNKCEYILFRFNVYFTEYLLAVEIDELRRQATYFGEKKTRSVKKRLGCKFRINTSDAERGYDTDYEVGKTQAFISKFKDKKIKELEDKIKKLKL